MLPKTYNNFCYFQCEICSIVVTSKYKLNKHKTTEHTQRDIRKMHYKNNLLLKINQKSQRKIYNCMECDKSYKHNTSLRYHNKLYHPEIEVWQNNYKCDQSDKVFNLRHEIDHHLSLDAKTGNNNEKAANSKTATTELDQHHTVHANDYNFYQCDLCGEAFYLKNEIERHIHVHSKTCHICGQVANSIDHLDEHLQTHYKDNKWQCDLCGDTFYFKNELEFHLHFHRKTKKIVPNQHLQIHCNENELQSDRGVEALNSKHKITKHAKSSTLKNCPKFHNSKDKAHILKRVFYRKQIRKPADSSNIASSDLQENNNNQMEIDSDMNNNNNNNNNKNNIDRNLPRAAEADSNNNEKTSMSANPQFENSKYGNISKENVYESETFKCGYCYALFPNSLSLQLIKEHMARHFSGALCNCGILLLNYDQLNHYFGTENMNLKPDPKNSFCNYLFIQDTNKILE